MFVRTQSSKMLKTAAMTALALFFATFSSLFAWGPNHNLSNNSTVSYTSYNNECCVAARGDTIHAVWYDSESNWDILYDRSCDRGATWGANVNISNTSLASKYPSIAVSGSYVHVAWAQSTQNNGWEIYYRRSTDRGTSWLTTINISNNVHDQKYPSISASGSNVNIVWEDARHINNLEIYHAYSNDNGATWETNRVTNNAYVQSYATISVTGSDVHVAWQDARHSNWEIYYAYSSNDGSSWSKGNVTNNPHAQNYPSIASTSSDVHLVWQDARNAPAYKADIYHAHSANNGSNWTRHRVTSDNEDQQRPSVAVTGANVSVVYQDFRNSNFEIYYRRSQNRGSNWLSEERITSDNSISKFPSIAIAKNEGPTQSSKRYLQVVWYDGRDGNYECYHDCCTYQYAELPTHESGINKEEKLTKYSDNSSTGLEISPNPMGISAVIKYGVPESGSINLSIYDVSGRIVRTLFEGEQISGRYSVRWDGRNNYGRYLPAGIYYAILEMENIENGQSIRKKIVKLK